MGYESENEVESENHPKSFILEKILGIFSGFPKTRVSRFDSEFLQEKSKNTIIEGEYVNLSERTEDAKKKGSGGKLLALFRSVGIRVRMENKINVEKDGKFVSISEKFVNQTENTDSGDDDK